MDDFEIEFEERPLRSNRSSQRTAAEMEIRFEGGGRSGVAMTRDVGVGGAFIRTELSFEKGMRLFLEMVIGGRRTKFRGLVVRVKEGEGVAVRFEELSPEDIRDLRRELKLA
jgi:hypothetical protein